MATFLSQVKSLTGLEIDGASDPSQTELTQWLTDGAVDVINRVTRLKPDELHKFAKSETDTSNVGIDVSGQVLSVIKGDYPATQISPTIRRQALDGDSMHYRSTYNPGWYSLNGRIYTAPAADVTFATTVTQVGYPTVSYGDENIAFTYLKKGIQTVTAGTETFNSTANTLSDGDFVRIDGLTGANAVLNGTVGIVTNAATNSFRLQNISIDVQASIGSDAYFERAGQGFADEYEYLVAMYAGIKCLSKKLASKESEVPSDVSELALEEGVLPVLGTLPVFNSPVTPSSTDIDFSNLPDVSSFLSPSFNAPILETIDSMNLPAPPTLPDLQGENSMSLAGADAPTFTAPVMTLPDVPTIADLNIVHTAPVAPAPTTAVMSLSGTAPLYVPPKYETDATASLYLTAFLTSSASSDDVLESDIPDAPELPTTIVKKLPNIPEAPIYLKPSMTMPKPPSSSVYTVPDFVISDSDLRAKITSGYNTMTEDRPTPSLPTDIPVYDPPVMTTPDWADANFWLSDEEDSEMVASRMQVVSGQIQEYSAKAQAAQSEFNEKVTKYQVEVQAVMQEWEAENRVHIENKKMYPQGVDVKTRNNLQNYSVQIQEYQSKVNANLTKWQYDCEKDIKKWQTDCDNILKKYNADQQSEMNEFQKQNVVYQAKIQRELAEFTAENQTQSLEVQKYQAALGKYTADINKAISINNTRLAKKTQIFQLRQQESLNKFESAMKNSLNSYNSEVKVYEANLQKDIKNSDSLNERERRSLEVYAHEFKEYTTKVQSDAQEYQLNFGKKIQLYQSEVQANMQKMGLDTQNALNVFNKENVVYQANFQKNVQNAQMAEAKDRRELDLYTQNLTKYQSDVNKELQRWTSEEYNVKFNKWVSLYQNTLGEYNTNIQKESARMNADLNHYQNEINKRLGTFQAETGLDMAIHQSQLQSATQKFQADLAEKTTAFDRDLQKYQSIIGNNNVKLQKYGIDIQNFQAKIDKSRVGYEWMMTRMMKLQSDYDAAFMLMQPHKEAN